MEIGIATMVCSSWLTAPDIDMTRCLEMISEVGYGCIEYNDQSLPQYFRASNDELKPVRDAANSLGIRMHSAHSPCGDFDLTSLDDNEYAKALDIHIRSVQALSALGVEYFVVHQVDVNLNPNPAEWPQRFDRGIEALTRLCEDAAPRGMKILIENFPGYGCEDLRRLIEAVGSSVLGICFDVGHAHVNGLPMNEEIAVAGDKLWSLHVHDNHGERDEHLIPGWGTVEWPKVLMALEKIAYAGPFMMEVMRGSSTMSLLSPFEAAKQSYAAARRILGDSER